MASAAVVSTTTAAPSSNKGDGDAPPSSDEAPGPSPAASDVPPPAESAAQSADHDVEPTTDEKLTDGNAGSSSEETEWRHDVHLNTNGIANSNSTSATATSSSSPKTLLQSEEEHPQHVSKEPTFDRKIPALKPPPADLEGPLPKELKRILHAVAKTGACSWLAWDDDNEDDDAVNPKKRGSAELSTAPSAGIGAAAAAAVAASSEGFSRNLSTLKQAPARTPFASSSSSAGITAFSQWDAAKRDAAGGSSSTNLAIRGSPFSSQHAAARRSGLSHSYTTAATAGMTGGMGVAGSSSQTPPPRKKHRNGIHHKGSGGNSRRRFGKNGSVVHGGGGGVATSLATTTTTTSVATTTPGEGSRKRPLYLIRTSTPNSGLPPAPESVGSGRTSGSEVEDSTQYECDSEASFATTNSEFSVPRTMPHNLGNTSNNEQPNPKQLLGQSNTFGPARSGDTESSDANIPYKTLQMALRVATGKVLDHFYHTRGGYKLSPAERRRNRPPPKIEVVVDDPAGKNGADVRTSLTSVDDSEKNDGMKHGRPLSPEDIFQQRRQKLLHMLTPASIFLEPSSFRRRKSTVVQNDLAPFTLQRIAEVLLAPERYYTQTHKLCNCLEKLLLVTSSTGAFGGSTGGYTSQNRKEEQELAALANEKVRQETKLRQKRLRKRASSPIEETIQESLANRESSAESLKKQDTTMSDSDQKVAHLELTGEAGETVASGETLKPSPSFPESSKSCEGNTHGLSSRELLEATARASLRTKFDHVGIDPHSSDRDARTIAENRRLTNSPPPPNLALSAAPPHLARVSSPILFPPGNGNETHLVPTASNMQMLQLHHSMAMAGVSLNRTNASPLDLMRINGGTIASGVGGLENQDGRSSASNSDVDSESDDVSFDDSASDRSDGSDSGSASHHEPFTAARAMALNRMQQQQRLQQSRARTSFASLQQNEGFRPPADSEYQSGDSIDSTRAEDSEGSDSSSSDVAD